MSALEAVRASFQRDEHGYFSDFMTIQSGPDTYLVYLRDTLPFEDATGVVPFTGG